MGTTGQGTAGQDAGAGVNEHAVHGSSAIRSVLEALRLTVVSGVIGAAIAAIAAGAILEELPVVLTGGGVLVLLLLIGFVSGRRPPGPVEPPVTRTALARIEDLRATSGESADVPVDFRLTVAPEPAARVGTSEVTAITIEERHMRLRGDAARPAGGTMHVQMLPYELFPALVHEARTTLGVRDPKSWRIDVTPGAGPGEGPRVRVTVTGEEGTAHLDADATARVVDRRPVGETAKGG
ncbi:hypothetical protein ACIQRW_29710 [Streptomyces sp. NPDC091287]|uniref:hypothetical protein n=1 Tax=Streptomyces sp. NPDC091287 TaxID=3365988 RepID=UPI00381E023A